MLYFIPTPIGNLGDISYRSLEILEKCEILFCEDTRVSKSLISLLNDKFNKKIYPRSYISFHTHNEKEVLANLKIEIFNQNIAYLSDAGMPCISDPGVELLKFAQKNKIKFEVLSGANAALVALVASGFCKKEFIFIGFLANKGAQRQKDIENALLNPYPCIIYESPKRVLSLVQNIAKIEPERELFVIKEISKKFETRFLGKAQELEKMLKNANLNGEWTLVINSANVQKTSAGTLCEKDILELDLALKTKAKLLAKINGKNPKEIYSKLILNNY